ncbi:MAG: hypothetical protein ACRELY_32420, partial [Polyangiaceae bacterium]
PMKHSVPPGEESKSRPERPFTLDLYSQVHVLQPRTMTVLHGPNGEGDDPGFGNAKLTGTVLVFGMIAGVAF